MTTLLSLPHMSQPLKLWEKLELITGEGKKKGLYTARIEDFSNKGIIISSPEFIKGQTLLRENAEVLIVFTKEDAAYQCYSRISKYTKDGKNLYLLSRPSKIKRVQRRHFVRVDIIETLKYVCLDRVVDWDNFDKNATWHSTRTENMSGGGVLIKTEDIHELETRVLMKIGFFPDHGFPDVVAGIIRRAFKLEKQNMAGIEFIVTDDLSNYFKSNDFEKLPGSAKQFNLRTQNQLVSYIFQQEVELRKKGLL